MRFALVIVAIFIVFATSSFSPARDNYETNKNYIKNLYDQAKSGDIDAIVRMGDLLYKAKKYKLAINFYIKAGERGNIYSINKLGNMLHRGRGVSKDYHMAKKLYKMAAEAGNKFAQYNLGNFYYHGYAGAKDLAKAKHWLTESCANGYKKACKEINIVFNNSDLQNKIDKNDNSHKKDIDNAFKTLESLRE